MKNQTLIQKIRSNCSALMLLASVLIASSCMKQKDTLLGTVVNVDLPPAPPQQDSDLAVTYPNPIILNRNELINPILPTVAGNVYPEVTPDYIITLYGSDITGTAHGPSPSDVLIATPIGLTVAKDKTIYVTEDGGGANDRIRQFLPAGDLRSFIFAGGSTTLYKDGLGTAANFETPLDIAVHPQTGDFYVTDGNRVRKITPGGVVTTFAGATDNAAGYKNGRPEEARFSYLTCITFDNEGNFYVGDRDNACIRKYTESTGLITTLAGPAEGVTASDKNTSKDETGSAARFNSPQGITIDDAGNIYVIDRNSDLIRKVTSAGVVTTIAGNVLNKLEDGVGRGASFFDPWRIAYHRQSGDLYVTEWNGHAIRKISANGTVSTVVGNGTLPVKTTDGVGTAATTRYGAGITVADNGNIYFAQRSGAVRMITKCGYSISPALPTGLVFDVYTGGISGVPTTATARTTYEVTAYNGRGEPVHTTEFYLTVQ